MSACPRALTAIPAVKSRYSTSSSSCLSSPAFFSSFVEFEEEEDVDVDVDVESELNLGFVGEVAYNLHPFPLVNNKGGLAYVLRRYCE